MNRYTNKLLKVFCRAFVGTGCWRGSMKRRSLVFHASPQLQLEQLGGATYMVGKIPEKEKVAQFVSVLMNSDVSLFPGVTNKIML